MVPMVRPLGWATLTEQQLSVMNLLVSSNNQILHITLRTCFTFLYRQPFKLMDLVLHSCSSLPTLGPMILQLTMHELVDW